MSIDTSQEVQADFFARWITVARLREILSELESDAELHPNQVGNLSVVMEGVYIGYIDVHEEVLCPVKSISVD